MFLQIILDVLVLYFANENISYQSSHQPDFHQGTFTSRIFFHPGQSERAPTQTHLLYSRKVFGGIWILLFDQTEEGLS